MGTPQFKHDCDACTFLGRHTQSAEAQDLYVCAVAKCPARWSFIARYGDDGPEYSSMSLEGAASFPACGFHEARLRARQHPVLGPKLRKHEREAARPPKGWVVGTAIEDRQRFWWCEPRGTPRSAWYSVLCAGTTREDAVRWTKERLARRKKED